MIEVTLNSSIFNNVIGLGAGYIIAGSFCLGGIIIFFADLIMIDKGYKVGKYMLSYVIAILILLGLYLFGLVYPSTIDNGSSGYKINEAYYSIQSIFLTTFFCVLVIKSILVIVIKTPQSEK